MQIRFRPLIERVLISKKLFYVMVPVTANFVAAFFHFDPTAKLILTLDFLFGLLTLGQIFLDLKFGHTFFIRIKCRRLKLKTKLKSIRDIHVSLMEWQSF